MGTLSKEVKGAKVIAAGDKYISGTITDTSRLVVGKVRVEWDAEYNKPACIMPIDVLEPYIPKWRFKLSRIFAFIIK